MNQPTAVRAVLDVTATAEKPPLGDRALLSPEQARALAELYKVLANDTRLRLLHALARVGEACVTDLATAVAMRPQAVSNQLQRLLDRRILATRREGARIFYRIADPCVPSLLDLGWCLVEETAGGPPARGE
jgi:ArsR family transcriptional regulator, lead/cadmium/zinc/bismuth-responsive transcriptional repressor